MKVDVLGARAGYHYIASISSLEAYRMPLADLVEEVRQGLGEIKVHLVFFLSFPFPGVLPSFGSVTRSLPLLEFTLRQGFISILR